MQIIRNIRQAMTSEELDGINFFNFRQQGIPGERWPYKLTNYDKGPVIVADVDSARLTPDMRLITWRVPLMYAEEPCKYIFEYESAIYERGFEAFHWLWRILWRKFDAEMQVAPLFEFHGMNEYQNVGVYTFWELRVPNLGQAYNNTFNDNPQNPNNNDR